MLKEFKKDNKSYDEMLTLIARFISNSNSDILKADPCYQEKKGLILNMLTVMSTSTTKKGNVVRFPSKDQLLLKDFHARIIKADCNSK